MPDRARTRLRSGPGIGTTRRCVLLCLMLCLVQGFHPANADDYTFTDAGDIFGPRVPHFGRGNAWGDLDGDGLYDLVTGSHDKGLLAFRQIGPLQFERFDPAARLATTLPLYGILILDFDRDGDNDVILNHIGFSTKVVPTSLRYMRNNGDATFTSATTEAGLHSFGKGFGLVALDYDKDGWIDVYVANHDTPNRLFRNDRQGGFEDVTEAAGVGAMSGRRGRTTSATSLDFDRDGWMDLYVGQRDNPDAEHETGNNHLLRNRGDGTFENVAAEAGVLGYGNDFVSSAGDVNGDNWTDLYIATFNFGPNGFPETDIPNRLYINNQDGTFSDVSRESHTNYAYGTMGLGFEDHDNDGLLDIYVGTGGPFTLQVEDQIFYWNRGDLVFTDSTVIKGLFDDARGHGISMFDYDRDGDLDIFSSMGGHSDGSERLDILYLNSGGPNHWLEVQLVGDDCPLEGLGARVIANTGDRELWRWVRSSGGFDSFEVPHVWFGLGESDHLESLEVLWPCGRIQRLDDVAVDQHMQLDESGAGLSIDNPTSPASLPPARSALLLRAENPTFRSEVRLVAILATDEAARISVYDLAGRRIQRHALPSAAAGVIEWIWDGSDRQGRSVASGRYLIELRQSERRSTASVVLVR